jgi:putative nucleotidyltransferase with HDIG domain
MKISWEISGQGLLRLLGFAVGSGVLGIVAFFLGFGRTEAALIMAIGAILSALAARLPWGGLLLPCDAMLLGLGLLSGSVGVAFAAVGAAVASSSVIPGWRSFFTMTMRNVTAVVVATALWQNLVPSAVVVLEGGRRLSLGSNLDAWAMSAAAVPALIIASVGFLVMASTIETVLRTERRYAFGEFWLLNYGKNLHHLIFTVILGAVFSVAYRDIGMVAAVLFAFPVVLTRDALKRSLDLRSSRMEALRALASSVDARDKHTYDHSNRVSHLACLLAREMGFTESTVEIIEGGAMLHDIGKLGVDTEILAKPGPLDDAEREAVRHHPINSADVVSRVELLKRSVDIVKYHHERPDGEGYPEGLLGHEIPVGARILNVADAFDAMTSDRPYRRRKTVQQAVQELRDGSGSEFDPVVVEYLYRLLEQKPEEFLRDRSE